MTVRINASLKQMKVVRILKHVNWTEIILNANVQLQVSKLNSQIYFNLLQGDLYDSDCQCTNGAIDENCQIFECTEGDCGEGKCIKLAGQEFKSCFCPIEKMG